MASGRLPDEGPVRLGSVDLPAGKLVKGNIEGDHVAWATVNPVPRAGWAWAALSELHPRTGLVPILLDGLPGDSMRFDSPELAGLSHDRLRPWDSGEFYIPDDPREADGLDVGVLVKEMWRNWAWMGEDDPELAEMRGPFTLEWPGLAPPGDAPLTPAERQRALDVVLPRIKGHRRPVPEARIGLVAADRPADVLAVVGWDALVPRAESLLELIAVLRSWEDRFGARLIEVGFADLRLFVERPPRTLEAAQLLAAEQVGLADECIDAAPDVPRIAARLLNGPFWTFWWD